MVHTDSAGVDEPAAGAGHGHGVWDPVPGAKERRSDLVSANRAQGRQWDPGSWVSRFRVDELWVSQFGAHSADERVQGGAIAAGAEDLGSVAQDDDEVAIEHRLQLAHAPDVHDRRT